MPSNAPTRTVGDFPCLPAPGVDRLVHHALALARGDVDTVATWLERLGGHITLRSPEEAMVVGPSGRPVALVQTDPVGSAILLGIALFDLAWPFVVPTLLEEVKKRWRTQRQASRRPRCLALAGGVAQPEDAERSSAARSAPCP